MSSYHLFAMLVGIPATLAAQQPANHASNPVVSPDGRLIVFSAKFEGDGDHLWLIAADGTGERQLTHGTARDSRARWATDGKSITFARAIGDSAILFRVKLDATGLRELGRVPGRSPTLLRDGKRVLFATGGWTDMQIALAELGSTTSRRISNGEGAIWNVAVSPDEKSLVYDRNNAGAPVSVWSSRIDGTGERPVTHFPPDSGNAQVAAWAPDGRQIAVQASTRAPGDTSKYIGNIWVVDVATGAARRLAPHREPWLDELPSWFPDGKRIAFQSDRTGRWEIWVMQADGSGARQVTR